MFRRIAAFAGMLGPLLFGGVICALTVAEYDFMRSLRWHPISAPTTDWPSGLALGPLGAWMTATFIASGALLAIFGMGLGTVFRGAGATLFAGAGLALACLAFPTDPTYRTTPATVSGTLHDLAYVALGLALLPGMLLLAREFWRVAGWRWLGGLTLPVLFFIAPAFVFKGVLFYVFLAGIFVWCECVAVQLLRFHRLSIFAPNPRSFSSNRS